MRQVHGPGALGRPRGMGWGGRWEGGSGWGTHANLWLIHVSVWQKPPQYCKVISLQLIKIKGKNKERKKEKIKLVELYCMSVTHIILHINYTSIKNNFKNNLLKKEKENRLSLLRYRGDWWLPAGTGRGTDRWGQDRRRCKLLCIKWKGHRDVL